MARKAFGPNTPLIGAFLARVETLTEAEGELLLRVHLAQLLNGPRFRAAVRAIRSAVRSAGRGQQAADAERAGRAAVRIRVSAPQHEAVAEIVGRIAAALVVIDLIEPGRADPLLRAWVDAIGPVGSPAPASRTSSERP